MKRGGGRESRAPNPENRIGQTNPNFAQAQGRDNETSKSQDRGSKGSRKCGMREQGSAKSPKVKTSKVGVPARRDGNPDSSGSRRQKSGGRGRGFKGLRKCGTREVVSGQFSVVSSVFSGDPQGSALQLRIADFGLRIGGGSVVKSDTRSPKPMNQLEDTRHEP